MQTVSDLRIPHVVVNKKENRKLYIPPEGIKGKYQNNPKTDSWALGFLLYLMIFGEPQINSSDNDTLESIVHKKMNALIDFKIPDSKVTEKCKNLMKAYLNPSEYTRSNINCDELNQWLESDEDCDNEKDTEKRKLIIRDLIEKELRFYSTLMDDKFKFEIVKHIKSKVYIDELRKNNVPINDNLFTTNITNPDKYFEYLELENMKRQQKVLEVYLKDIKEEQMKSNREKLESAKYTPKVHKVSNFDDSVTQSPRFKKPKDNKEHIHTDQKDMEINSGLSNTNLTNISNITSNNFLKSNESKEIKDLKSFNSSGNLTKNLSISSKPNSPQVVKYIRTPTKVPFTPSILKKKINIKIENSANRQKDLNNFNTTNTNLSSFYSSSEHYKDYNPDNHNNKDNQYHQDYQDNTDTQSDRDISDSLMLSKNTTKSLFNPSSQNKSAPKNYFSNFKTTRSNKSPKNNEHSPNDTNSPNEVKTRNKSHINNVEKLYNYMTKKYPPGKVKDKSPNSSNKNNYTDSHKNTHNNNNIILVDKNNDTEVYSFNDTIENFNTKLINDPNAKLSGYRDKIDFIKNTIKEHGNKIIIKDSSLHKINYLKNPYDKESRYLKKTNEIEDLLKKSNIKVESQIFQTDLQIAARKIERKKPGLSIDFGKQNQNPTGFLKQERPSIIKIKEDLDIKLSLSRSTRNLILPKI